VGGYFLKEVEESLTHDFNRTARDTNYNIYKKETEKALKHTHDFGTET
jgi:hypothetical protein